MQILASLFFLMVFALAVGVIAAMLFDYRERIVAALAGDGFAPRLGVTFTNLSAERPIRDRRARVRKVSSFRPAALPLTA